MDLRELNNKLEDAKQKIGVAVQELQYFRPRAASPALEQLPVRVLEHTGLLEATESRYRQRQSVREENREKFDSKAWLEANDPSRIEKRLGRLGHTEEPTDRRTDPLFFEAVFGGNDLQSVNFLELGWIAARTVGRIVVRNSVGRISHYGTGFMVSPRLLLTNNHVISNADEAFGSMIEFNYQEGLDGGLLRWTTFNLDPDSFFITDEYLDYSLVAVSERASDGSILRSFGWNRLIEEQGKLFLGEYVSIIQHPSGQPKQLALRENRVIDILDDFLHYETDTAPGSSGAPVYNDQWEVLCLHHSGVPKRDDRGRILTTAGTLWTRDMGDKWIAWEGNEGVRVSRIVQHVRQQSLSTTSQRRLRNEMFEAAPPLPVPSL